MDYSITILAIVGIVIVCEQVEGGILNKHWDAIEEFVMAGTKGLQASQTTL